jgi:hypothetical protein
MTDTWQATTPLPDEHLEKREYVFVEIPEHGAGIVEPIGW